MSYDLGNACIRLPSPGALSLLPENLWLVWPANEYICALKSRLLKEFPRVENFIQSAVIVYLVFDLGLKYGS